MSRKEGAGELETCPECRGSGNVQSTKCNRCNGTGKVAATGGKER